jgi:hypothetical protein
MLNKIKNPLMFWASPAAIALLLVFAVGTAFGLPMVGFGACVASFGFISYFVAANYDRQLGVRITQPQPWEWMVHVNGVEVGTIRDVDYAAILRKVLRDDYVATAQLASFLKWAIAIAAKTMIYVPVMVFWTLALIAVALPDELVPFLQKLSAEWHARPSDGVLLGNIIGVMGVFSVFSAFLTTPARSRCYTQAVNLLIRQHFDTPADGDVWVYRMPARGNHASGI